MIGHGLPCILQRKGVLHGLVPLAREGTRKKEERCPKARERKKEEQPTMALPSQLVHSIQCIANEELGLSRGSTTQDDFTHVVVKNQAEDKRLYLATFSRKLLNQYRAYATSPERDACDRH